MVGLGSKKDGFNHLEQLDESRENVRRAAALGCQCLIEDRCGHIFIEGLGRPEQAAEGCSLAIWRYQDFKNKIDRYPVPTVELYEDLDHEAWQRGLFKAEAQNLARKLTDAPGNYMTPTAFAQEIVKIVCPCGIKTEIRDKEWMYSQRMHAILLAARGSCEPPLFIEITYCGAPVEEKPIALIGKGTTFNSGGLCLRDAEGMKLFRADMSGAACVVAVIRAAAQLNLPLNLVGLIPLCENMPSGMSMKSGDMIQTLSGKTIEIKDTSSEGRLILADTFHYAQNSIKPRTPKLLIDMATMTSGVRSLLGSAAGGCFSNSEVLWKQIHKAGMIAGDRLWRLPIWKFYKRKVENGTYTDLSNTGLPNKLTGEPCLTAAFLSNFVDCMDWIHIDTFGVGMCSKDQQTYPYYTDCRMTGRPSRTVIQLLYQLACPQECDS